MLIFLKWKGSLNKTKFIQSMESLVNTLSSEEQNVSYITVLGNHRFCEGKPHEEIVSVVVQTLFSICCHTGFEDKTHLAGCIKD